MLNGRVTEELQAKLVVEILDLDNQLRRIEVILDTGFNGQMALPTITAQQLGLVRAGLRPRELADGSVSRVMTYTATVLWDGQPRSVQIVEADGEPLLGMELLLGSRVTIDVSDNGPVTIDALPGR